MNRVRIGARGPWVSRLCFGTLIISPIQKNFSIEQGSELLEYAVRKGINFVDTAEYYRNYRYLRHVVCNHPDLVICTKSYAYDTDGAKMSIEKAQEGIGREHIDIMLLHEQESYFTLKGHSQAFDYYKKLQGDGVIGAVGISTHYCQAVRSATLWPGMDVIFAIANKDGIGIPDGNAADMETALANAHEAGIFIMGMKALGGGHLIARRTEALKYVVDSECLDVVALGMQSKAEIDYNVAVFSGTSPDGDVSKESMKLNRQLVIEPWCTGCGNCVRRCKSHALYLNDHHVQADDTKCARCGYCAAVCPEFCIKVV